MPFFETSTPDGIRQLSDDLVYFRLEQKLILDETGWTDDPSIGQSQLVRSRTIFFGGLSMADGPIAALSCTTGTFARIADTSGGINVTVSRINRSGAGTVTLFLFSKRRPPDPGYGVAFYDTGGITFSILSPLVKPIGTFDEGGYSGVQVSSGQQLAHIPQRRGIGTRRSYRVGNQGSCTYSGPSGTPTAGYQTYYTDTYRVRFVKCSGNVASLDDANAGGNEVPFICNPGFTGAPATTYTEQLRYRSLIIDVTNI